MTLSYTSPIFQQVNSPAIDVRRFVSILAPSEGVAGTGDMAVTQRGAGANYSVDIAAGRALVQGDSITNQGMYYAYNDGTINLTGFTAAHATLPRIDRVCLRVRDAFHGDAANDLAFVIVTGTATSGATLVNLNGVAAVPASHLLLANILIPAASSTITTANIDTAVRPLVTSYGSELAHTEFTSSVNCTATTEATANTIVTGAAVTADGVTPLMIEFWCEIVAASTTLAMRFWLYDSLNGGAATSIGSIGELDLTSTVGAPAPLRRRLTPASGSHVFSVRGSVNTGTGTATAGAGGNGLRAPGFIRIIRA